MRFLLLIQFLIINVFAIVDIASVDFGEKKVGFSGSAFGSFQKKRGNTNKDELEYGGRIEYDTNKSITWMQGVIEHDEASGAVIDENRFLHLRHIFQIFNPDWAVESYIQLRQNKFRNIQERRLYGAGPRYKVLDSSKYGKLFLGVSLMDEKIRYNSIDPDEHNYRASSYVSGTLRLTKNMKFSYLGYYQPEIDRGSDYVLSSLAEITVHISEAFDLSYLLDFNYDSMPPSSVDRTDMKQRLSFIYRFGKSSKSKAITQTTPVSSFSKTKGVSNGKNTLLGEWRCSKKEKFIIRADGKGEYFNKESIYKQKIRWKINSLEDKNTKLILISFIDEENRVQKQKSYLLSKNSFVGLEGETVHLFRHERSSALHP